MPSNVGAGGGAKGLPSCLPELLLALLIIDAADETETGYQIQLTMRHVLSNMIDYTGTHFETQFGAVSAGRARNMREQLYPYTLRTVTRWFLCSVLYHMHGPLFDGSDEAKAIRLQLDKYMDFATYDTSRFSKLGPKFAAPKDAGPGCQKIWQFVTRFPTTARFGTVGVHLTDVAARPKRRPAYVPTPVKWNTERVGTLLRFTKIILEPGRAAGKVRKIPEGLYALPARLASWLSPGVLKILTAKGNWSRYGKIVPPCPRGLLGALSPSLAPLFGNFPGGFKKSGDIMNPFGSVKGYDHNKCKRRAADSKAARKRRGADNNNLQTSATVMIAATLEEAASQQKRARPAEPPTPAPKPSSPRIPLPKPAVDQQAGGPAGEHAAIMSAIASGKPPAPRRRQVRHVPYVPPRLAGFESPKKVYHDGMDSNDENSDDDDDDNFATVDARIAEEERMAATFGV